MKNYQKRSLIIRDITLTQSSIDAYVIDSGQPLALGEFAYACQQSREWVEALIEHSILEVNSDNPEQWQFLGEDLARARRAWRLQRDFDASLTAVALMLELLDEVKQLRAQALGTPYQPAVKN